MCSFSSVIFPVLHCHPRISEMGSKVGGKKAQNNMKGMLQVTFFKSMNLTWIPYRSNRNNMSTSRENQGTAGQVCVYGLI